MSPLHDCSLSATKRFPSPRQDHGTVCQPKWRHQIRCKPSKPNWNHIYSWRPFHSFQIVKVFVKHLKCFRILQCAITITFMNLLRTSDCSAWWFQVSEEHTRVWRPRWWNRAQTRRYDFSSWNRWKSCIGAKTTSARPFQNQSPDCSASSLEPLLCSVTRH